MGADSKVAAETRQAERLPYTACLARLSKVFLIASLAAFAGAKATAVQAAPDKIYASSMQARLQYRGFSVARLPLPTWYMRLGEQSHTDAMIRRDLPEGTHSAFVSVALRTLPRAASSEADFGQLARQDQVSDRQRFTVVSYYQKPTREQGQWAVNFDVTIRDKGAPVAHGKTLVLHQSGRVVRHPTFPNGVVIITFSERGTTKELGTNIQTEGREISEGVRLESAPGRPLS